MLKIIRVILELMGVKGLNLTRKVKEFLVMRLIAPTVEMGTAAPFRFRASFS